MEYLPKNSIVDFAEGALENIRKKYGYDSTERVKEAIDILDAWIKRQDHFVAKEFPPRYLEATLMSSKGSIEKTKKRIDKMCTFRTLLPQFFKECDIREDFKEIFQYIDFGLMPKQTKDYSRVIVLRISENKFTSSLCLDAFRFLILVAEYMKMNDYTDGFSIIVDYRDADILDVLRNINVMDLRNGLSILIDGVGARIKGIYLLTDSSAVEMLVTIFKQAITKKIGDRVFVYKDIEELYKLVPKDSLPAEYGGMAKPLTELKEIILDAVCSKEAEEYRRYMNSACTNEQLRPKDALNHHYLGIPGSFRSLTVD